MDFSLFIDIENPESFTNISLKKGTFTAGATIDPSQDGTVDVFNLNLTSSTLIYLNSEGMKGAAACGAGLFAKPKSIGDLSSEESAFCVDRKGVEYSSPKAVKAFLYQQAAALQAENRRMSPEDKKLYLDSPKSFGFANAFTNNFPGLGRRVQYVNELELLQQKKMKASQVVVPPVQAFTP